MLADRSQADANAAAEVMANAGYQVSVAIVDVSLRETVHALVGKATEIGEIVGLIHAAGVSPSQASLYGTAVVLEPCTGASAARESIRSARESS